MPELYHLLGITFAIGILAVVVWCVMRHDAAKERERTDVSTARYCVTCAWCLQEPHRSLKCQRFRDRVDATPRVCEYLRMEFGPCGPDGKCWEPKPED